MKSHPFTFNDREYKLAGLTADVKDEWMDPVRARMMARAKRMHDKKLIDDRKFVQMDRSAQQAGFHSEAAVEDLAGEEGRKRLVKLMLPEDVATPEFIDALYEESKNLKSSFSLALASILKDAYPDFKPDVIVEGEESGPKAGTTAS